METVCVTRRGGYWRRMERKAKGVPRRQEKDPFLGVRYIQEGHWCKGSETRKWQVRQAGSSVDGARLDLVAVRNVLAVVDVAGIDDIIGCVFLRSCRGDVSGVGFGSLVGGNRLVVKAAGGHRRSNVGGGNAENLLMINVVALVIDVGVVAQKYGHIDPFRCRDRKACVTWLNNVDGVAVLVLSTQADSLAKVKVCAFVVNDIVDGQDLIGGCTLGGTYGVASVSGLNSVRANAVMCGNALDEQWKGAEGSNDERSEHGERGLFVDVNEASGGSCEGCIPSGIDRSEGL